MNEQVINYASKKAELCKNNDNISPRLYDEYGVKKGLRDENGKGVLAGLTNISKIISSKIVTSLKEKGLVQWSHDGDGSEGTYVSFTESGRKIMDEQEKILKEYYSEVAKKFGEERLISLLSLMKVIQYVLPNLNMMKMKKHLLESKMN